ncbi:MAG: phosphatase PAP2 family protein [Steroidobacteraceae bacterium]
MSTQSLFLRIDQAERRVCLLANAAARGRVVRGLFQAVSRLGDGVFWYALMAILPVAFGFDGLLTSAQMLAAGLVGLALYKVLKHSLVRERPFIGLLGIECAMPPLDRYSFPSGHTLHAVLFTCIAVAHFPVLAVILVPFALLVAASRVILGLHYPTDVAAGAALGSCLAIASEFLR